MGGREAGPDRLRGHAGGDGIGGEVAQDNGAGADRGVGAPDDADHGRAVEFERDPVDGAVGTECLGHVPHTELHVTFSRSRPFRDQGESGSLS